MSKEIVFNNGGEALTNSKIIGEVFGKSHFHVLESIKRIDCSDSFRKSNFRLSSYVSMQNKRLDCYEITKDGFAFLAFGYTGKKAAEFKEKYILAFNNMQKSLKTIDISLMDSVLVAIESEGRCKAVASKCGYGLSAWRKLKPKLEGAIKAAKEASQYKLNF